MPMPNLPTRRSIGLSVLPAWVPRELHTRFEVQDVSCRRFGTFHIWWIFPYEWWIGWFSYPTGDFEQTVGCAPAKKINGRFHSLAARSCENPHESSKSDMGFPKIEDPQTGFHTKSWSFMTRIIRGTPWLGKPPYNPHLPAILLQTRATPVHNWFNWSFFPVSSAAHSTLQGGWFWKEQWRCNTSVICDSGLRSEIE